MSDIDDLFTDPNGPAYQSEETRTGPPLDYVAEKLKHSLESLHSLMGNIERHVPASLPSPWKEKGPPPPLKDSYLLSPGQYAFHYGLVAYLALHNLLGVANDHHLGERLLTMPGDEFREWLERIRTEGSVTG